MSAGSPVRVGALRLAILLTAAFNVLAVVVLVRDAPIAFTVFMFGGPGLAVALDPARWRVPADLSAKKSCDRALARSDHYCLDREEDAVLPADRRGAVLAIGGGA
jgi:hypothetical protein